MIAALPMYDRAETRAANDALWAAMADRLADAPMLLNRDMSPVDGWQHPDLYVSQTCGLPYTLGLHDRVQLIGCPDFNLPETPAGYYHSVIVVRSDDTRPLDAVLGGVAAINELHSQSGHNALFRFVTRLGKPLGRTTITGAHVNSAKAIAQGAADFAAIDANTWRMIEKWDESAAHLRIVARTEPTPAMPYICGASTNRDAITQALRDAMAGLTQAERATLGLFGLVDIPKAAFFDVAPPPMPKPVS